MAILLYITYFIALGNNLSILYEREHRNPLRHYWCLSLIPVRSSSYNVFQYAIMQDINKTSVCSITIM